MSNEVFVKAFNRIADLMEIDGENGFRVNSYRRAARTLKDATADVKQLAGDNRLTELQGIGKGIAEKIEQLITDGKIDVLEELEAKIPEGLPALLEIQGLGPKKIAMFHDELGVTGIDDLKKAIESGSLAALKGMGKASVERIADGIKFLESSGGRSRLGESLICAELLIGRIKEFEDAGRIEIAGSVRRGRETTGDIDILCETKNPEAVVKAFTELSEVQRVLAAGSTKGSVIALLPNGKEIQVDLRAIEPEAFGAALQYFTGSKEHNVRVREVAVKRGWKLNEYGLYDGDERIAGKNEKDIYAKLEMPCFPPELREDRYEFGDDIDFGKLIAVKDIRGDLHMHTVASDGKNSIEEMAEAARNKGYDYIAIADHSRSSTIANGLSIERMEKHIEEIRKANDRVDGIEILVGTECDILPDGTLDYPDELLARTDWVVASIHAAMGPGGSDKLDPTERTLAAIENKYVCQIAHPTGRLINKRAAMDIDFDAVAKAAAESGTALEINSSWYRLDLKDVHVRQVLDHGVTLVINTDAHHTAGLDFIRFGVMTARRAATPRKSVLNAGTLNNLRKFVKKKRAG